MSPFQKRLLAVVSSLMVIGILTVLSAGEAMAQVRPAMVRDADNGALQPFRARATIYFTAAFNSVDLVTVPAGKRLVIEHVSWSATVPTGGQIIFAGLFDGNGWPHTYLDISSTHASLVPSYELQLSSEQVKVYLEPGEVLRFGATQLSPAGSPYITVVVQGHYVTL